MKSGETDDLSAKEWLGRATLEHLLGPLPTVDPATYDECFEGLAPRMTSRLEAFRREKREAQREAAAFLELSPKGRRQRLQRNYSRLKNRSFVLELLRHSRRAVWTDLGLATELAGHALEALRQIRGRRLITQAGGKVGLADLELQVQGQLGNTARLERRWGQAIEHFARAFIALDQGSQDPELEAELHSLYGSLLRDRQHFATAFESMGVAADIYRQLDQKHRRGRVLLKQATVLWELDRPEDALALHREAVLLLDEGAEPETALAAWSNLANLYFELERAEEALSILRMSVPLARDLPKGSSARLCWVWVAGRVALLRGHYRAAERRLRRVLGAYTALGDPYNAGRAGLDLSRLYALLGRLEDLEVLMPETVRQLLSQDLHRDARRAVEACRLAVEQRRSQVLTVIVRAVKALERSRCGVGRETP